jgi:hypothetical protein
MCVQDINNRLVRSNRLRHGSDHRNWLLTQSISRSSMDAVRIEQRTRGYICTYYQSLLYCGSQTDIQFHKVPLLFFLQNFCIWGWGSVRLRSKTKDWNTKFPATIFFCSIRLERANYVLEALNNMYMRSFVVCVCGVKVGS